MIQNRVSFPYDLIPCSPTPSIHIRLHVTRTKISSRNESFRNKFILVVAPDQNFPSGMKSSRIFHKNHVDEVRSHSGTELSTWMGWADQLIRIFIPPMFVHGRWETLASSIRSLTEIE